MMKHEHSNTERRKNDSNELVQEKEAGNVSECCTVLRCLDENILREIFAFVGPGCYRYIAVNKQFQALYLKVFPQGKQVYARNAVQSIAWAKIASEEVRVWSLDYATNLYLDNISKYSYARLDHGEDFYRFQDPKATICPIAARYGKVEVVKWCRSVGLPWHAPVCVRRFDAFPEMWRYLMWNDETCQAAARGGHLNIIVWARKHNCPWTSATCAAAALGGHLNVLAWIRANGCPWNEQTCSAAAFGGHLEVLKYARQQECPWSSHTCKMASKSGHLNILQWAHLQGCPWDKKDACYDAARYGNLEMLRYAVANGCELEMWKLYDTAAKHGHVNILKWAVDGGDDIWNTLRHRPCDICIVAAERGDLSVIQWAVENGYRWDPEVCACAAARGHLDILVYVYNQGLCWDSDACTQAACARRLDILQWLTAHGCPWDQWIFRAAIDGAIDTRLTVAPECRDFEVLKWVLKNGRQEILDGDIDRCIDKCVWWNDAEVLSILLQHYFGDNLERQNEARERAAIRFEERMMNYDSSESSGPRYDSSSLSSSYSSLSAHDDY